MIEFSVRLKDYAGSKTYNSIEALTKTLTTLINDAKDNEVLNFSIFNVKHENTRKKEIIIGTAEIDKKTGIPVFDIKTPDPIIPKTKTKEDITYPTFKDKKYVPRSIEGMNYEKGKEMIKEVLQDGDWAKRAKIYHKTGLASRTLSRYLLKMRSEEVLEFMPKGNMFRLIEKTVLHKEVKKDVAKKYVLEKMPMEDFVERENKIIPKMTYEKGKEMIKAIFKESGNSEVSRAEIFKQTGLASRTLSRYLIKMVDEQEIENLGKNIYQLVNAQQKGQIDYEKGKEMILAALDDDALLSIVDIHKITKIAFSPLTTFLSRMKLNKIIYYNEEVRKYRKFKN